MAKSVRYSTRSPYETLNALDCNTRCIWVVFHGLGYLSKYFLRFFDQLPQDQYIIAPQAPSTYYADRNYRRIGANWLTRDNTDMGIANILSYLDAIMEAEELPTNIPIKVLGFSQGVSIACRWVAHRDIVCERLILWSGGLPKELLPDHFCHLPESTKVSILMGKEDPYFDLETRNSQITRGQQLFGHRMDTLLFEGGHELDKTLLPQFL